MGTLNVAPVTPLDYRRLAEKRLPRFLFDYIDGGANDELTMAANIADFQRLKLKQRVMRDVSNISTATTIAGEATSMPVILAPVGMAGLMARRGEVQGVRAANAAGVPFTLSTVGICPLEEVAAASSKPFWFQLYMIRDRGIVRDMLTRAQAAGCTTLVFTVDLPIAGMRHRDARNGMGGHSLRARVASAWQIATHPIWVADVGVFGKPHSFGNLEDMVANPTDMEAYKKWLNAQFDCSVTWKDIEWLRGIWPGKLIIKGILEADDAIAAVAAGADGVIVSNHGGRQLDTAASGISKLPEVAAAVGDKAEVLMDGGVRSGIDVVKALALGARAVLIGRPWVWANAARGQAGVSDLLAVFKREMEVAMALTGVTNVAQLNADLIDR
ncbi:MAG: L-lactate dehydrogenase [Rhodocyclaceae bacterium]|nr:L-lactate dehydrogenase [Rhodocyclaceae bacterium]MBP6279732.1 L-lactate dehydrogenase [Rhodocyclaceae bacterium]